MGLAVLTFLYVSCLFCENGFTRAGVTSENSVVSDIERLNNIVDNLAKQNAHMMGTIAEQETRLSQLEAENKASLEARDRSAPAISRKERLLLLNQEQSSNFATKPAFTARLSKHLDGIGNQQTVIFDVAETNVGKAYSPLSGVFTAPANGTYFFLASILSKAGEYLETEIVLNGNNIALMYCQSPSYDQGTSGVVVTLKENDLVWVRHVGTEGTNVHGYNWSAFTGFQI